MKPKNVSTTPASAKAAALMNLLSMEVALPVGDGQRRPLKLDGRRRRFFSAKDRAQHAPQLLPRTDGKSARSGLAKLSRQRGGRVRPTAQ
jgi:hypothetical protein